VPYCAALPGARDNFFEKTKIEKLKNQKILEMRKPKNTKVLQNCSAKTLERIKKR
jgi:hypothetical protein